MNPLQLILTAALYSVLTLTGYCTGFQDWTETARVQAFTTSLGAVTRTDATANSRDAVQQLRTYTDTAGCTVYMGRIAPQGAESKAQSVAQYALPGTTGLVRSYSLAEDSWTEIPIEDGLTLGRGMYFVRTDQVEAILVTPLTYTGHGNGMIEYLPDADGTLSIRPVNGGYMLTLSTAALSAGTYSDFLVLLSDQLLIDWTDPVSLARWSNYRFTDANRWCCDGYYYTAPSSYYPTGENYFYPLPAAHIAGKMARNAGDPASRALGLAMIDIMREKQNEYGFIPSQAGSEWLKGDYNIDPGYFDTRFNTDFWLANLNAAENFGVTEWLDRVVRYADFLMEFASTNHFAFGSGENEGWLVADYWHPNGVNRITHSSLNHHASEAVFLYRLTEVTGDDRFALFADRMVRGIELTADRWLMANGSLYYAYLPDGSMMDGDYPSLTYNDLLDLQTLVIRRRGTESAAIATLLDSKLDWMLANGVTDYNHAPTV